MPVKGKNPTITMKDVAVFTIVMMIFVAGMLVLLGVNLGDLRWEVPESRPDFVVTFTGSSPNNSVSYVDGAIGYYEIANESAAHVNIQFEVFCHTSNNSWFELAEYDESREEWTSLKMQEGANKTFTISVQIEMLQARTFAIWYCEVDRQTHDIPVKFILESYKGTVRVRPV